MPALCWKTRTECWLLALCGAATLTLLIVSLSATRDKPWTGLREFVPTEKDVVQSTQRLGAPPERTLANGELPSEVRAFEALGLYPPTADAWADYRRRRRREEDETKTAAKDDERQVPPPHARRRKTLRAFVDWPHSTFSFAEANYAALESLSATADSSEVTATVVAPDRATQFRYSNANSYTQFERYRKLTSTEGGSWSVETRLVNARSALYPRGRGHPGQTWWARNRVRCCPAEADFATYFGGDAHDVVPSTSTTLFLRLQALWRHGGVFADLSLFFLRAVPETARGFVANNATTMLLSFPEARDPALACALRKFDACADDLACAEALSVATLLEDCVSPKKNDLVGAVDWSGTSSSPHVVAAWLGPAATDGSWPSSSSSFPSSRLELRDEKCRRWLEEEEEGRLPPCGAFQPGLGGVASQPTPRELRLASRAACAPSLFIPAAQKGASSYLFELLAQHPQTLRPLRGSQYKEPGAYTTPVYFRQPLAKRVSRFPYSRPSEHLVNVDGTVTYATESRLPAMRAALDSPFAKVIFALREPADRSFSDYRFCYRPHFERADLGWDQAVTRALPLYEACFANASSSDSAAMDAYYGLRCERLHLRRADAVGLVRKSLYYYQLRHFADVFGRDAVVAVTAEQLKRDPVAALRRVVASVGFLCPFDGFQKLDAVHVTSVKLPSHHYWSRPVYDSYRAFLRPHNRRLFDFLHADEADLLWNQPPPDSLRGHSSTADRGLRRGKGPQREEAARGRSDSRTTQGAS